MNENRERLTWKKIRRFCLIPFRPAILKTWMTVARFEDISVDVLVQSGVKGVLLDVDGTLGPHHSSRFSDSVVRHIYSIRDRGIKIAIFTNAFENRFQQLEGFPVVTQVPPKPDPEGFRMAMKKYLQLEDAGKVCMVGDNFVTDGGAVEAGMLFVYVNPISGNESWGHRVTRNIAYGFAKLYSHVS